MQIEYGISSVIDSSLIKDNQIEIENHVPSGKLTASYLHQPKRFQLLKYLGVPEKELDTFKLRKFSRGRQVEDWFIDKLKTQEGLVVSTQETVEYRGVVGRVDAVINQDLLGIKVGNIPHEIKSVTNKNFKYIQKGDVGEHYKLQAGLYALAKGSDYFCLDFIASDDLRDRCYLFETSEVEWEIEKIINEFTYMVSEHIVPEWDFRQQWQNNPDYMNYDPIWTTCNEYEFRNRLDQLRINY